jgi:regulator of RNase E activity RraA
VTGTVVTGTVEAVVGGGAVRDSRASRELDPPHPAVNATNATNPTITKTRRKQRS